MLLQFDNSIQTSLLVDDEWTNELMLTSVYTLIKSSFTNIVRYVQRKQVGCLPLVWSLCCSSVCSLLTSSIYCPNSALSSTRRPCAVSSWSRNSLLSVDNRATSRFSCSALKQQTAARYCWRWRVHVRTFQVVSGAGSAMAGRAGAIPI